MRYRGKGNWYKGRLVAEDAHGMFSVAYDDGDSEENVVPANVKLLSGDGKDTVIAVPGTATDLALSDSNGSGAGAGSLVTVDPSHVKPVVALVGIKGAGKSTLLKAMGGDPEPKPRPTTGFMQRKLQFEVRGVPVLVHWYDLPGGWTSKWETYLTEVHGVVYVVDSAAEEADFAAAVDAFKGPVMEDNARVVSGKPLLVLANKQDEGADKARSGAAVAKALDLAALCGAKGGDVLAGDSDDVVHGAGWRVEACSCHPMKNNPGGESKFDTRIEKGLEWLLESIVDEYEALESRVKIDAAAAERKREEEKLERKKRVMCKVLREKAFPSDGEEPVETFPGPPGYEYFAMELLIHDPQIEEHVQKNSNENNWGLTAEMVHVVELVGYQKMAMQMCAEMINPEKKKSKPTYSWEEVTSYVMDRREEAGLSRDLPTASTNAEE